MRDLRFSRNVFGVAGREAFRDRCRLAERLGYPHRLRVDHLGASAPFPVLVAAADATDRLRVGTLVLNVAFWNPALLAARRFFIRALRTLTVVRSEVVTDAASVYPLVLDELLPSAWHYVE
jgi:hypothetical protein